jgi:hypothetical protein
MPSYTLNSAAGTTRIRNQAGNNNVFHSFEFKTNGTATAGGIIIQARRPGAPDNIVINVDDYDFASPKHIDFIGPVAEWVFTVQAITGNASLIYATVTSTPTGKDDGGGISPSDQAKLDAITSTGSGEIITATERSKINGITSLGSGAIITTEERAKINSGAFISEEDQLMEGLALGGLYAKQVQVG